MNKKRDDNMTNLDKIHKETIDIIRTEAATNPDKIPDYILNLYSEYYSSYVNNDMVRFQTISGIIKEITTTANEKYNNVDNFINYSKVTVLTKLMNTLFKRDESLELPHTISINQTDNDDVTVNLLEKVKQKRIESNKVFEEEAKLKRYNDYFMKMDKQEYMKQLIRPDVDPDFINENINIIENILTDDALRVIKEYIKEK